MIIVAMTFRLRYRQTSMAKVQSVKTLYTVEDAMKTEHVLNIEHIV